MRQFGIVEKVVESTIYVCNACHEESYEETVYEAIMETKDGKQTGNVMIQYYTRCAKCKEFFKETEEKIVTEQEYDEMEYQRKSSEKRKLEQVK